MPLALPGDLTLTGAAVDGPHLVVTAVAHNVSEPMRPDRLLSALDSKGVVRLYRPVGETGVR